jgi:hypothetical protein
MWIIILMFVTIDALILYYYHKHPYDDVAYYFTSKPLMYSLFITFLLLAVQYIHCQKTQGF